MRKIAIALVAIFGLTSVAHADWNGHRHYPRHHYHGGGGNNNWVAPLVGGLVIGGLLMSSQQNYYAGPGYGGVPVYNQPACQNVFTGSYWNGWRWVNRYQVVCNNYDW